jgi:enamine deaminase RidA (YjgF/YER057c/UK114 family)
MSAITRNGQSRYSPTRGRSVAHAGVLTTVATATEKTPSAYEQSRDALSNIDANLAEAGIDKSRIITVMVYIANMDDKPELNRAWDEWVDRDNLPVRACLGVDLEGDDLVELVVTAALEAYPSAV